MEFDSFIPIDNNVAISTNAAIHADLRAQSLGDAAGGGLWFRFRTLDDQAACFADVAAFRDALPGIEARIVQMPA